jgi:hypothetical protein
MRMRLRPGLIALPALLVACNPDISTYAAKHTTVAERTFAAHYLALLAGGQIDSAVGFLVPDLRSDTTRRVASRVGALLATARLDSLHLIGVNIFENLGTHLRQLNLTYEGPTRDGRWVVANVATNHIGDTTTVYGFSAYPLAAQLETANAFTRAHLSAIRLIWLALALLMPVLTIGLAVWVLRTRMRRRWLWAIVALIASPAFALNWTTGHPVGQVNIFLLFGGAAMRGSSAAPWIISFGLPLGAIVSYFRYRAWREAVTRNAAPPNVAA